MTYQKQIRPCGGISADLLAAAAANPEDAPERVREHLARCPECKAFVDHMVCDLTNLSRMAVRFTPALSRPITHKAKPGARVVAFRTRPVFAFALAACLVLAFVVPRLFSLKPETTPGLPGATLAVTQPVDAVEAGEEGLFAENMLSPVYLEIAGEDAQGFEEDFSAYGGSDADSDPWPDIDPGSDISRILVSKGAFPC